MLRTVTALVVFLLMQSFAFSQGEIRGRLTDAEGKGPLVGATISIVGTKMGAVSDVNGDFVIANVPPGQYNVRIAYVGYIPVQRRVTVASSAVTLDVTLDQTMIQSSEGIV